MLAYSHHKAAWSIQATISWLHYDLGSAWILSEEWCQTTRVC